MIDPRQIRAARALLNWSQTDLAEASGIAVSSIKNVENSITTARKETLDDIQQAFEKAGVEFVHDGVKLRRRDVQVLNGKQGFRQFFDDVYDTMKTAGGEIYVSGVNETVIGEVLEGYGATHIARMNQISSNVHLKCLVAEGDTYVPSTDYCEYRVISREFFLSSHFYVFGEKVGIISILPPQDIMVIVMDIPGLADYYKKIFFMMWERSKPFK
jgi:transcriptional regulator with XRE-family HTH domain